MAELTGQTFAGFEVVAKLGQGGMGAVYKARQPLLDRFVALKVMSQQLSGDPAYVARFVREAASAAKLNHPNMVEVFTAGEQGGIYYIVMEFVEGESLNQRLKRTGPLDPAEAIAITLHVTTALQCAWNEAKLIHRDIKPDNIFLSKKGEVKVGDLGLAKSVGGGATEMTQSGMMMGSPHYMSPEQAKASKETDFRADIYSLGCTLYQLLTGKTPYQADESLALILKHVTEPAPDILALMPHYPPYLAALVGKMMAKAPDQRHSSYEELIAELWQVNDLLGQQQSAATAVMMPTPAPTAATVKPTVVKAATVVPTVVGGGKPVISNWRLVIGGMVAVAALLLIGLFLWSPWKSRMDEQGSREAAKQGSESRLQAESVATQPAKAGTPDAAASASAALKLLGNVFTNSVGAEMVYIPPGEFMLGSTKEEQAWVETMIQEEHEKRVIEKKEHEEKFRGQKGYEEKVVSREGREPRKAMIKQGFWMGRTEVTVGQWKQFVKETGYVTDGEKKGESEVPQPGLIPWHGTIALKKGASWQNPNFGFDLRDDHPACCISWNDAMAFCKWLTQRESSAGRLPAGHVVRLPTEAEWEYACRAGTQTKFWWGDSTEDSMGRLNWGNQNDGFTFVAPVDSYGARGRNGFGLADIQGNVAEWCLDVSDPRQAHEDLWTGSNTSDRVIRGASFISNLTHNWRSARRLFYPLDISRAFLGFRLVVGVDVTGGSSVASLPASVPKEAGILAPPETRVTTLTTNPKVGEVYTLPLGSNVTMELMGIPPGEFLLGSTKEEQEWANSDKRIKDVECEGEAPRKAAIKQGFWMARTEVTVGQWKQFIKETGYVTDAEKKGESLVPQVGGGSWVVKKGVSWRDPDFGVQAQDNHPVCCISWNDAMAFCEWLEAQEKRSGRLPANCSLRLPTEAEWEYACRAGTQTKFWWGESQRDGAGRLNLTGETDGGRFVTPVDNFGARGRNGFGLADMLGNVYEWCLDGGDPTRAHEDLWTGNSSGRALRGGSFRNPLNTNRCAHRHRVTADYSASCAGFRVMLGRALTGTKTMAPSASVTPTAKEAGILAPPETRVAALTTNPKVGEVYTLPLGSNVTMELMGIPPGEFMLGSTKEERTWAVQNGASADYLKPEGMQPRKARIKQAFWLGRTEVTVGQWKQFVAATRYQTDAERKGYVDGAPQKGQGWNRADGSSWRDPGFGSPQQDNHPVCCVSWNDAVAFCEWLTEQERKAGRLLATQVVRLPTEVEWEYACRAGTQTKFWWGESKEDGNGRLNWKGPEDGFEFVAPVDAFGSQGRNGFGLADMLGNMLEWCLDGYDETQAHEKLWIDNTGQRVLRCGGFRNDPAYCRCAYRFGRYPSRSAGDFGFRVAVAPVQ